MLSGANMQYESWPFSLIRDPVNVAFKESRPTKDVSDCNIPTVLFAISSKFGSYGPIVMTPHTPNPSGLVVVVLREFLPGPAPGTMTS
jgi:hypothetical protein